MTAPKYKRILLKLSGEAFKGSSAYGFDSTVITKIAKVQTIDQELIPISLQANGGLFSCTLVFFKK